FEVEHRFRRGDGAYRWFLVRAVPSLIGGELKRWYGSITDVHDQKTFSDQLAKAKDEAERANQTKSFFLANMSHEIRTPLSAILGFTELLKEEDIPPLEKSQYLDTITRNGVALTKIIDDILDLAKVESGKLDVEKIDFSFFDLIDDVMDLFRERSRGKGLFLRFHIAKDTPNRIYSDPTRLRQILINIVGNAVKFTEFGGITIEVSTSHQNDRSLRYRIAVIDTGVGLSAEQRSRLFEPFMQADNSTTRKFGGTGLGLALSQRLAAALGGEITIEENRILRGSVFIISFLAEIRADQVELERDQLKVSQAEAVASGKLSGLYVLVADDSPDNLFLAKRILTKNGAKVKTVANGSEAVTVALEEHFDVILMDIQMPVMDGYEATRALREAGYARPIIALTAHAMAEERAKSIQAGCNGHLTKPLNQGDLVEGIRNLVNRP
ncbi:MAG: response regulator, partial [Proteobacteria bacterium]